MNIYLLIKKQLWWFSVVTTHGPWSMLSAFSLNPFFLLFVSRFTFYVFYLCIYRGRTMRLKKGSIAIYVVVCPTFRHIHAKRSIYRPITVCVYVRVWNRHSHNLSYEYDSHIQRAQYINGTSREYESRSTERSWLSPTFSSRCQVYVIYATHIIKLFCNQRLNIVCMIMIIFHDFHFW